MYKVKGEMTPDQRVAHERKLLDAMLWMRRNGKARVDRETHATAILAQVERVRTAQDKADGA